MHCSLFHVGGLSAHVSGDVLYIHKPIVQARREQVRDHVDDKRALTLGERAHQKRAAARYWKSSVAQPLQHAAGACLRGAPTEVARFLQDTQPPVFFANSVLQKRQVVCLGSAACQLDGV